MMASGLASLLAQLQELLNALLLQLAVEYRFTTKVERFNGEVDQEQGKTWNR